MDLLWSGICLFAGLLLAAFFFNIALRLGQADVVEADKSAARVGRSWGKALLGQARTVDDWLPYARIKAGMIYNERENRFEASGRLSNEAFGRIFRRRA